MAFSFTDLIDKIKGGKKPVPVKRHIRKETSGNISVVDAYTRFIDKNDGEIDEQTRLDNLEEPEIDENESEIEVKEPDYADEDIYVDTELSKNELLTLPKIKEEEIIPLIKKWQTSRDENAMYQLISHYSGLIHFNANKSKTGSIPNHLAVLEAKRLLVKAADTFDANRGIKFNTHLTNYLKKLYRFINDNTNIAKIPEQRVRKINDYKMALAQLEDRFDREPTDIELSNELSWPIKEISRLRAELNRSEILDFGKGDKGDSYDYGDLGIDSPNVGTALRLIYMDATPEEKFIIEHITGLFNKKHLTTQELAKKLKIPESKIKYLISNIKTKIIENV